eukprot:15047284-Alexandrium_andersonii.AAC.1
MADWRIADWGSLLCDVHGFRPPRSPASSADSESAWTRTQNAPVGDQFRGLPGPVQFQVRMPEAILHFPQGGLRTGRLYFGHPAM